MFGLPSDAGEVSVDEVVDAAMVQGRKSLARLQLNPRKRRTDILALAKKGRRMVEARSKQAVDNTKYVPN